MPEKRVLFSALPGLSGVVNGSFSVVAGVDSPSAGVTAFDGATVPVSGEPSTLVSGSPLGAVKITVRSGVGGKLSPLNVVVGPTSDDDDDDASDIGLVLDGVGEGVGDGVGAGVGHCPPATTSAPPHVDPTAWHVFAATQY